jgi:hypothetical protein
MHHTTTIDSTQCSHPGSTFEIHLKKSITIKHISPHSLGPRLSNPALPSYTATLLSSSTTYACCKDDPHAVAECHRALPDQTVFDRPDKRDAAPPMVCASNWPNFVRELGASV